MFYRYPVAALTLLLASALPAPAGCSSCSGGHCSGGGCGGGMMGPPPMLAGPPPPAFARQNSPSSGGYAVQAFPDDPDQIAVFKDGRQVGGVRFSTGTWMAFDAATHTWARTRVTPAPSPTVPPSGPKPCDCSGGCTDGCHPGAPECPCVGGGCPNFGVESDRVTPGRTTINGKRVTQAQALAAVRGGPLPDDAGRPFLTVIGTEAECARVTSDLGSSPALAAYRDRVRYQTYQPEDWAVKGMGFAPGHPAVYLQNASGAVLHRQDAYAGPEALATALRKADPAYDPSHDPDLTKPPFLPFALPEWLTASPEIWIAGAVVAGLLVVTLVRGKLFS